MPWYIYIALRHLFPQRRLPTFFTLLSVIGVAVGVMVLIVVISVFNGFGYQIRKVVAETSGDLKLISGGIFEDYEGKIETLLQNPLVKAASPSAFGVVMLQEGNRPIFPNVQGIEVDAARQVVPLDGYVTSGSLDELDDDSLLISSGVSYTLRLGVGDEVEIYSPLMLEKLKREEVLLPRVMRIVGVFETGFGKIDENLIITTLRCMQDMYGMGEGAHAINIKLVNTADPEAAAASIQSMFKPPYRVSSWLESNAEYLAIIEFEKRMMFFILLFIVIMGSLSISTSLMTTVVRKTREIGLFASMGATRGQIAACFCAQGLAVGVFGTAAGFALALTALSFRDSITDAIFWMIGSKQQTVEFYFFSQLPVHRDPGDLLIIAVFSVSIATLAGLLPAYRASTLKPVEALRNE